MSDDGYIPLKQRFKAWWHGNTLPDGAHCFDLDNVSNMDADEINADKIKIDQRLNGLDWTKGRIDAVQLVWGRGQVHAGGDADLERIMKKGRIDPDTIVLDLTAGLGAASRFLPDQKDCGVMSVEAEEKLVAAARATFAMEIDHYDPIAGGLSRKDWGTFAAVLSRNLMYTLDKTKTLNDLSNLLFPEAVLVISDFAIDPAFADHPAMQRWLSLEPVEPSPWTIEEYRDGLDRAKLDTAIIADETEVMTKIAKTAWNNCWNSLASEKMTRGIVDALAFEAEIWMHRLAAMESGGLRYVLVHGKSREKKIRKLTN